MPLCRRVLSLLALVAFPASAVVVPAARAQVACEAVLTASVTLTADLTCMGTTALVVGADKITIDLGGFTLTGSEDLGVDNGLGFDGVTIKNGTIRGFNQGISIGGNAQKNVVSNVRIVDCPGAGIDLNDSDATKVGKTTILGGGNGVQIGTDGTGNVVEKSFIVGTAGAGVQIFGTDNLIQKNQLARTNDGIRVLGGGNRVLANAVDRCRAMGVAVGGGSGSLVSKNTLTGCVGSGVDVRDGATGTIVKQNTIGGNGNYGIGVFASADGTVLEKNKVRGNDLSGVWVEGASGVLVSGNTSIGNREDGIHVASPATLVKNTSIANQLGGIRTAPPGIDGGGNKANANVVIDCEGFVCP